MRQLAFNYLVLLKNDWVDSLYWLTLVSPQLTGGVGQSSVNCYFHHEVRLAPKLRAGQLKTTSVEVV